MTGSRCGSCVRGYALRQVCQGLCAFSPMLVLRAHYTADVFAAIVTALWAASVAEVLAPSVDRAVAGLLRLVVGASGP